MNQPFTARFPVRFNHVDPAGIVFYPRYFELLNAAVEDWFAHLGTDFRNLHLHHRLGTPTVSLQVKFTAPAILGDLLEITIRVREIGRSSCCYGFAANVAGAVKLQGEAVLVCMDLDQHKSAPWPDEIKKAMLEQAGVNSTKLSS